MAKRFVASCPFCSAELEITELKCGRCSTRIDTTLKLPSFLQLPHELQGFVLVFLACRGNIREVEKRLEISYPTVCKRLDQVNELLNESGDSPDRPRAAEREARGRPSRSLRSKRER
jgi:hypothetical protein